MRSKLYLSFFIIVLLCGMSLGQTITVTSPNGGENWVNGSPQNITWTSSGISSGNFTVLLFEGTTKVGTIQAGIPCSDGPHSISWTVGNLTAGGSAPNGSNYKIKVRQTSAAPKDFSNSAFTISGGGGPAPSITVTSPNGGQNWQIGGPNQNITWTSTGISSGAYRIVLYDGGGNVGVIATNIPHSTHSYSWNVGHLNDGTVVPAGLNYKIKVKLQSASENDMSNSSFQLSSFPEVEPVIPFEVYQPKFNETYSWGMDIVIKWRKKLKVLPFNSKKLDAVKQSMIAKPNIVQMIKNVKIEIKSVTCPIPITKKVMEKMYSSEKLKLDVSEIQSLVQKPWEVQFTYWKTIAANTRDDGSYTWKVPVSFKKGCYKIRITKLHGAKSKAESSVFRIIPFYWKPGIILKHFDLDLLIKKAK